MGREVKRVPLDFNWPMKKIWYGYQISFCHEEYYKGEGCKYCKMFGKIKGIKAEFGCPDFDELHKLLDVPKGEGWQMWEDTTEGSPMSPVFKTPEELAEWLAKTGASSCGYQTASKAEWLSMIKSGWAPSGAMIDGEMMNGVKSIGRLKKKEEELK